MYHVSDTWNDVGLANNEWATTTRIVTIEAPYYGTIGHIADVRFMIDHRRGDAKLFTTVRRAPVELAHARGVLMPKPAPRKPPIVRSAAPRKPCHRHKRRA